MDQRRVPPAEPVPDTSAGRESPAHRGLFRRAKISFLADALMPSISSRGKTVPHGIPFNILGLWVSGDLSGYTIYCDRHGRITVFPKAPPKEPPSEPQRRLRERFAEAQANYMALNEAAKADWETLTQKCYLCMTGQNLFISHSLRPNPGSLAAMIRNSGIDVETPTPV